MGLGAVSRTPHAAVLGMVFGNVPLVVVQAVRMPETFLSPITPQFTVLRLKPESWLLRLKVSPSVSAEAWPRSYMKSPPDWEVNPMSKSPVYVAAWADAA